jgi:hypothetical protein
MCQNNSQSTTSGLKVTQEKKVPQSSTRRLSPTPLASIPLEQQSQTRKRPLPEECPMWYGPPTQTRRRHSSSPQLPTWWSHLPPPLLQQAHMQNYPPTQTMTFTPPIPYIQPETEYMTSHHMAMPPVNHLDQPRMLHEIMGQNPKGMSNFFYFNQMVLHGLNIRFLLLGISSNVPIFIGCLSTQMIIFLTFRHTFQYVTFYKINPLLPMDTIMYQNRKFCENTFFSKIITIIA